MKNYIEREALLEDIENTLVFSGRPDRQNPKQMGARLVVQRIRCASAADVAPVVRGRWNVEVGMNWFKERICPVCKKHIESNFWNYCPNCGARMDGE